MELLVIKMQSAKALEILETHNEHLMPSIINYRGCGSILWNHIDKQRDTSKIP